MEEEWRSIPEFPNYEISNYGQVYNRRFQRLMRVSQSNHGHTKVTLQNGRGRFTRSVAQLVAEAFVEAPNLLCDNLMILDGELKNVRADNLAWRPRTFAWKYTHQLKVEQPDHYYHLPVLNTTTNSKYRAIVEAGVMEGLLFDDIWRSTYTGKPTYPYGCVFEIIERV